MLVVSQYLTSNCTTEPYKCKNRYEDQWNRNPDINPCSYAYLIFDKDTEHIQWRKVTLIHKCWENCIAACRKLKPDPSLSTCTSTNSKWIKDLNIKPETCKLLQESAGNTMELKGIGNGFTNRIQMAQQLRKRIDNWNKMKLKICTTKEMVSKLKRLPTEWEKNLCQLYI
jgi:hypothetical protein